jgi:hypothetical protein
LVGTRASHLRVIALLLRKVVPVEALQGANVLQIGSTLRGELRV